MLIVPQCLHRRYHVREDIHLDHHYQFQTISCGEKYNFS